MTDEIPAATLAWVERETGGRIARVEPMPEASHTNHHVTVETSGASHELLLRRYTDGGLLRDDPWYQPADEVAALQVLEGVELPVPRLVAGDVAGERGDIPALLLTYCRGCRTSGRTTPRRSPGRSPRCSPRSMRRRSSSARTSRTW
jgi:hypothetical protein